jgi:hypothetical protein
MTIQASTTAGNTLFVMICKTATMIRCAMNANGVYDTSGKRACAMSVKSVGAGSTARPSDMNCTTAITIAARDGSMDKNAVGTATACLQDKRRSCNDSNLGC